MPANAVSKLDKPNTMVLFDEDYRAHIELLDRKLARERQAVIKLREQVRELQAALATHRR